MDAASPEILLDITVPGEHQKASNQVKKGCTGNIDMILLRTRYPILRACILIANDSGTTLAFYSVDRNP